MRVLSSTPLHLTVNCRFSTPQLLAFATDELSIRVGETLAGLINATLVRAPFRLQFSSSHILRLTKRVFSQGNA